MSPRARRRRYGRGLSLLGQAAALAFFMAVLFGAPRWLLLCAGLTIAAVIYGRYRADQTRFPETPEPGSFVDPPDVPPPPPATVERFERFDDWLPSKDPDFFFLFSCTARWRVSPGTPAGPDEGLVRALILEHARQATMLVPVGDPALATELATTRLRHGVRTDSIESGVSEVRVEDATVRVDRETDERWRNLAGWRREVDLARAKRGHLNTEVWSSSRDALLWQLAQQPDLSKAVAAIEPVRRLLHAFADSDDLAGVGGQPAVAQSDDPLSVQLVRQMFPADPAAGVVLAMKLADLFERSGQSATAKELEDAFGTVE